MSQDGDGSKDARGERLNTKEQAAHHSGDASDGQQPEKRTESNQPQAIEQDEPEGLAAWHAESDPNADLSGAPRHYVGKCPKQAHGSKGRRSHSRKQYS